MTRTRYMIVMMQEQSLDHETDHAINACDTNDLDEYTHS